jgi:glycosyltransferase involved in cell wall biosynthesis
MRIAQVAPLYESVPPQGYGGTERVVSYLTEELVAQGHDVTLFASGDSVTHAHLIAACPRATRLDPNCRDPLAFHFRMLGQLAEIAARFDLIHFHIDYLHFPLSHSRGGPRLTTLHGRLDLPELRPLYLQFPGQPVVSISDAQRRPLPFAHWIGTVYHGLPPGLHTFRGRPGEYLAFLGRVSPEKGLDRAIAIARRVGMPLKIAAKIDRADQDYYTAVIQPLLRAAGTAAEFIGEVGGRDKDEFLGHAYAVLFPIDWPEPFGLVMIEALACGTPVIAFRHGSVPEVIQDGLTGFIVEDMDQAAQAVGRVAGLSRAACRRVFEDRFSAARMARLSEGLSACAGTPRCPCQPRLGSGRALEFVGAAAPASRRRSAHGGPSLRLASLTQTQHQADKPDLRQSKRYTDAAADIP